MLAVRGDHRDRLGQRAVLLHMLRKRRLPLRPIDVEGEEARHSACDDAVIETQVGGEESLNLLPILRGRPVATFDGGRFATSDNG
jgi:hypothetical protein